ncbi:excalibur calcium-binding domain-containing protein [Actinomadura madurae]|uniref:excalibur calcium-binding domain-containing protein n=1 Tax=Actinomadura madurae TaxID=1993 RepID=UPI0020D2133D|nr:excalibur calcium-binding domain-containing protein [Actinomadura madurae]MCP9976582.1 excalibur calcium-binding domain-containing protein [Actinomadura madurae]MCQ0011921.1 excalibur calcium-binding domain-containing protein [Actinomadura madurae]
MFGLGGCAVGAAIAAAPDPGKSSAAASSASPKKTRRASSSPTPARTPKAPTITDGTWRVPAEVKPGTWRTKGGDGCYWARLSGFSGMDDIIANELADGAAVVTIKASDKGFQSKGCGTWKRVTPATAKPKKTTSKPTTSKTKPRKTQAPTVDTRYSTCAEANRHGLGPYRRGQTEYTWYQDRDGDGIVCEP